MPGHIYIAAMNPAAAFALAAIFAVVWRRFPANTFLFPLIICFVYLGLGFIAHDFGLFTPPGGINYAGNALVMAAVTLACVSALMRARVRIPYLAFGAVLAATIAVFMWSSWVAPSVVGRIMAASLGFAGLTITTLVLLVRAGLPSLSDRLIAAGISIAVVLIFLRPLLVLRGVLGVNPGGDIRESTYWETVQAFSPLVAVGVAAMFLFAVVSDLVTQLRRAADTDYLTGLSNRRGFEEAATDYLAASRGADRRPALLLADIDDFKKINDAFGHAVGDTVICAIATALRDKGGAALAGRVGGEEFALFYPNMSRGQLRERAHDVQLALRSITLADLPAHYPVTVSIGLHVREGTETLRDMFMAADKALYRAKQQGKNRAVHSPARLGVVGESQSDPGRSRSA